MTVTAKALVQPVLLTNAQVTQYTTPASTRTIIDKMTAYNSSGAPVDVSINLVPSAGAAGAGNLVVKKTLAAGATDTFPEVVGHVLNPGDLLSTLASVNTVAVYRVSGREVN